MNTQLLTTAQRNTIHNLQQAKMSLQRAMAEILLALGDSDVTVEYLQELSGISTEIDLDIEDTYLRAGN